MGLPVRMLSVLVVAMVAAAHSTPSSQQEEDMGDCIDDNGHVCGSRGLCIHGSASAIPFSGRHCQDLWVGSCGATKDCVQCYTFGTGPLGHAECAQCFDEGGPVDFIHLVDHLDPDLPLCLYRDEDDCVFQYTTEEVRPHSRRLRRTSADQTRMPKASRTSVSPRKLKAAIERESTISPDTAVCRSRMTRH